MLEKAEEEGETEYVKSVMTIAYSPQGRLAEKGRHAIAAIALVAADAKGHGTGAQRLAHRWRARLERTPIWATADNALKCWGRTATVHQRAVAAREAGAV